MKKLRLFIGIIAFTFASFVSLNHNVYGGNTSCYWEYEYCDRGDCFDANDCPSCHCVSMQGTPSNQGVCQEGGEQ